jgi:hypothetical protein
VLRAELLRSGSGEIALASACLTIRQCVFNLFATPWIAAENRKIAPFADDAKSAAPRNLKSLKAWPTRLEPLAARQSTRTLSG